VSGKSTESGSLPVAVVGAGGRLGSAVLGLYPEYGLDVVLAAGRGDWPGSARPQVVIDAATADAARRTVAYCRDTRAALVSCASAMDEQQLAEIADLAKEVPVVRAANLSIGHWLQQRAIRSVAQVAAALPVKLSAAVLDRHTSTKRDRPSATALVLAQNWTAWTGLAVDDVASYRSGLRVCEHQLQLTFGDETLTFHHQVQDLRAAAYGAVDHLSGLDPAERKLTTLVALGARSLSLGGHDDFNQGQVSARLPNRDRFLIKAALCGFDECGPGDVVVAAVDPSVPPGPLAPPELPLHQAVYEARPDVNAIVHSHAPHTLVFGATDLEVQPVSHDGAYFHGRVGRFELTSNTILDIATGRAVAAALGPAPAAFLRNHGGVIVGKSIKHAIVLAQVLERACRLQLMAEQLPGGYHVSKPDDIPVKREVIYSDLSIRTYWDYCVRLVIRTWPEAGSWRG
jgi:L-fuculose-phosphate aldolase